MKYAIRLVNCAFFARHGVHDEEERMGQRFYVDADMSVDAGTALGADRIDGTVDYGAAFGVIERVVMGTRRRLIETLALDIASAVCERFPQVRRVAITVRKPMHPSTACSIMSR